MKHKTCFILGSGRSLLRLTAREKEYINSCDFVLAFNKYLIFADLVGIKPTHYLLGDTGAKADLMLLETVKKCRQNRYKDTTFIMEKAYQPFSRQYYKRKRRLKKQWRLLYWLHNRSDERAIEYTARRAIYIERYDWLEGGNWARSLKDKIFHFRGSLSGAINLANILHPDYAIKLLGVDLDNHAYFFQEEIESNPKKWGVFLNRLTPESEQHETIVTHRDTGGIQEMFPYIQEQVEKTGGHLYCCNPESYLVKNNIVPYAEIED